MRILGYRRVRGEQLIPDELRGIPRWVIWKTEERDGKTTKVLYRPHAPDKRGSSTDPGTWSDYEKAEAAATLPGVAGIGFCFNGDGLIGVDFDHVRNPETGLIDGDAWQEIRALGSYTEVSPSGTGVHVLCRGKIPGDKHRTGPREMYESGRYFTVTGKHVPGTRGIITDSQPGIDTLYKKWFPQQDRPTAAPAQPAASPPVRLEDDQVIDRLMNAANGDKFTKLMQGDISGYPSQSEAESAFCSLLAFWSRDPSQIDRIYRRSKLCRPKWDEMHGARTYGETTINNALVVVKDYYGAGARGENGRPVVIVSGARLRDISDQSLQHLVAANDPPWLFVRERNLARVCMSGIGLPVIEKIDEPALRGILERTCDFIRMLPGKKTGKNQESTYTPGPDTPSTKLCEDVLSLPAWPFPVIDGITLTPIINLNDGSLFNHQGYDPKTRIYYHPPKGTTIPPVSEHPTRDDVKAAVNLLNEPFIDFPIVDDASRTHITAALLTAVLRPSLPDIVPLFLLDKPAPGTGASLIAKIISVITLGSEAAMVPAPKDEDGWKKLITSMMIQGATLINVDNVEYKLYAPSLALLATTNNYTDRLLGFSKVGTWPNKSTWILNGNNITIGGDLPRRVIWTRMDALSQRPWQREKENGYKHPDVLAWTSHNRGEIIAAVLTLVRYWIQQGKPGPSQDTPKLGGYEKWRDIIGGILHAAGYNGFLANLEQVYEEMDVDGTQWDAFINRWYELWQDTPKTAADIIDLVRKENDPKAAESEIKLKLSDALPDDLTDAIADRKGSSSKRVGNALRKRKDRVFSGELRLVKAGTKKRAVIWKVQKITLQITLPLNSEMSPINDDQDTNRVSLEKSPSDVKVSLGEFTPYQDRKIEKINNYNIYNGLLQTHLNSPSDVTAKNETHPANQPVKTGELGIENRTISNHGLNPPVLEKYGNFNYIGEGENNLQGSIRFENEKEAQNEVFKIYNNNGSIYHGMNRVELTTILDSVKGDPNKLADREAFDQAWKLAG